MNCKEYHLPELELATGQVREALKAILHTILFIRSPGPVSPVDVHCENFNLTYTRIAGPGTGSASSSGPNHIHNIHHQHGKKQNHFLDKKVDDSIEEFLKGLVQIGPELLSGCLTLSFFERRASKQLFGLVSHEEKVIWEQWILRIVVNNTPRPVNDDSASIMERQRIQDTSEAMLRSVFFKTYDYASGIEDHGHAHASVNGNGNVNVNGGSNVNVNGNGNGTGISISSSGHGRTDGGIGGASGAGGSNNNNNNTYSYGSLDHIPPTMYEFEIRCSKGMDDRENVYSRVANMPALLNLDGN